MKKIAYGMAIVIIVVLMFFSFNIAEKINKIRYPIKYENLVSKYAEEYELDPYLIYSIIRTESAFDAMAVSKKDARGLMQIMPETGKWIAEKLKIENFNAEDLYTPEKNIMMGVWYFKYLMKQFNNDVNLAIVAYNAGPGNAQNWLNNENISSDGVVLDKIPFSETEKYQKKIVETYKIYQNIYCK